MLLAIVWTQKVTSLRDCACFEPLCVKISRLVTSVGESRKKIKIKKRGLIFHVFGQALPYYWLLQILGCVFRLVDVINCEGSKFDHSHWIAILRCRSLRQYVLIDVQTEVNTLINGAIN